MRNRHADDTDGVLLSRDVFGGNRPCTMTEDSTSEVVHRCRVPRVTVRHDGVLPDTGAVQ